MSVEQVARDFVASLNDPEKLKGLITADAVVSGGVLPQPAPMMEAMGIMGGLATAMPDLSIDIDQVTVSGNDATVKVHLSGTQSGPLSLPLPGMPTVPPTGKEALVKDAFVITVQGDKVSHMHVESPVDGGIPGVLAQLGVKFPGM
jgi:hypothetical protein